MKDKRARDGKPVRGKLELRERDGVSVVVKVGFAQPAGEPLPDVILHRQRLYHLAERGDNNVYVESIFFEIPNTLAKATALANTE